ncbi:uncharacterized protein LOC116505895 [Thamnophis elegans]|uniref:uncharacterized protein LOC116505895 n=1 Tax=Thamnophis elegans TaxID=35005 RepID=UPI00137852A5|nr:uncharacterized protein LOC116505895 [Thamnophis elegans]
MASLPGQESPVPSVSVRSPNPTAGPSGTRASKKRAAPDPSSTGHPAKVSKLASFRKASAGEADGLARAPQRRPRTNQRTNQRTEFPFILSSPKGCLRLVPQSSYLQILMRPFPLLLSEDGSGEDQSPTPEPDLLSQDSGSPPFQSHSYTPDMATIISDAIERGIAAGLQHKSSSHSTLHRTSSGSSKHCRGRDSSVSLSCEIPGLSTQPLVFGEEECPTRDSDLLVADPPTFVGLRNLLIFHSLLFKAKKIPGIPAPKSSQGADPNKTDTTDPLFSKVEKDMIPSPRLFLDVVQNQSVSPGTGPLPNTLDKRLYNVRPELFKVLEVPSKKAIKRPSSCSSVKVRMTPEMVKPLECWVFPTIAQGSLFREPQRLTFTTNASLSRWGAHLNSQVAQDLWSHTDQTHSINWLELRAIHLALLHFQCATSTF